MANQNLIQNCHCLVAAAGGMECDRVDIRIARAIRLDLGRAVQFRNRFVGAFEAGQRQAERMM